MDHNSAKFDKEDLALQRILKDVFSVSNKRPSGSVRKDVLQKNFAKITKSIDLSSTSKCLSEKVQLAVEIERLRRTVRKCHAALEPVQNYTDRRLEYYHSISNKESSKNKSPKRKYKEDKSEDEEILEEDSCDYEYNGEWTCEVDGVKMKFRRINE